MESLEEIDENILSALKRFQLGLKGGDLCVGTEKSPYILRRRAIFDGVYIGKYLRIVQNLNGTGVRLVQVMNT